ASPPGPGMPSGPPASPHEMVVVTRAPRHASQWLQHEIRQAVWDECVKRGYHPWRELITVAMDPETPLEVAVHCHETIASYLLPKLRAVEMTGQVEHQHTHSLAQLFEALEEEEAQERETLPPWTAPPLDLERGEHGVWADIDGPENDGDDVEE